MHVAVSVLNRTKLFRKLKMRMLRKHAMTRHRLPYVRSYYMMLFKLAKHVLLRHKPSLRPAKTEDLTLPHRVEGAELPKNSRRAWSTYAERRPLADSLLC